MHEEKVEVEFEDVDEVESEVLVEEEGQHGPQALELAVVLEHHHLRRKYEREVGDLVEVDSAQPVEHQLVNEVDNLRVESLGLDHVHEHAEDVGREERVAALESSQFHRKDSSTRRSEILRTSSE